MPNHCLFVVWIEQILFKFTMPIKLEHSVEKPLNRESGVRDLISRYSIPIQQLYLGA